MAKLLHISRILLITCFLAGCGPSDQAPTPTPTPMLPIREVKIPFNDNPEIRGTLFGSGDIAVILVHMGNIANSQKDWAVFAKTAARENFTVLTIDVPGFGKTPVGDVNPTFEDAVLASITYLEDLGFDRIVCIGASAGGNACLSVAEIYPLAGLGVLSSALVDQAVNYPALSMPKFFACTESDGGGLFVQAEQELFQNSSEPKELHVFRGDAHGTEIFLSYFQGDLTDKLIQFLRSLK